MEKNLFSEFEEISAKQWKQKIQFDLKGADYNEKLVWKSPDGIHVKPFYHPDEAPSPAASFAPSSWNIVEQIYVASPTKANKLALDALAKGAESLWFVLPTEDIDYQELFKGIDTTGISIHLKPLFLPEKSLSEIEAFLPPSCQAHFQLDILGNLSQTGNWFVDLKQDHKAMEDVLHKCRKFRTSIAVDTSIYQNAGANIPQQLAYSMAHVTEYFHHFSTQKTLSESRKKCLQTQFIVSVGSNYFFEIAKLRALRLLYATLAREYGLDENCYVLAQPTRRNKTIYDYHVNLLRTTTECMSAILGGSDGICNMAYDALYHKNNQFGRRIARNQLLILKHESFFDKVANPSDGSYYIESLTQELAEKALSIFKQIEQGGGFLQQLKEGIIQKKIAESATKEQELFDSGQLVLIGSNKFPNPDDRMQEKLQLYPFLKYRPRKTLIPPILQKRLAETIEKERLEKEKKEATEI